MDNGQWAIVDAAPACPNCVAQRGFLRFDLQSRRAALGAGRGKTISTHRARRDAEARAGERGNSACVRYVPDTHRADWVGRYDCSACRAPPV